jgi:hypothetical protein
MAINKIDPLSDDRGSAPSYKGGLPLSVGRCCCFGSIYATLFNLIGGSRSMPIGAFLAA